LSKILSNIEGNKTDLIRTFLRVVDRSIHSSYEYILCSFELINNWFVVLSSIYHLVVPDYTVVDLFIVDIELFVTWVVPSRVPD